MKYTFHDPLRQDKAAEAGERAGADLIEKRFEAADLLRKQRRGE